MVYQSSPDVLAWLAERAEAMARETETGTTPPRPTPEEMQAIETARHECRADLPSYLMHFDSAGAVYSAALKQLGVAVSGIAPGDLRAHYITAKTAA